MVKVIFFPMEILKVKGMFLILTHLWSRVSN